MKTTLTALTILVFLGMVLAGPFSMGAGAHGKCLASAAQGVDCPGDGWLAANFHLDAIKWFSQAFLSIGLVALALLLLWAAIAFRLLPILNVVWPAFSRLFHSPPPKSERRILSWLKFHENSPPRR